VTRPRALITGVAGQDGSYLAELLLSADYEVLGVLRPGADASHPNLVGVRDAIELVSHDLLDADAAATLVTSYGPGELYHLASGSFIPESWDRPLETARLGPVTTTALLEAARELPSRCKCFLASSAAVFGEPLESPQNEDARVAPITPYGAAKAYTLHLGAAVRRRYGQFAVSGILYNHESPRRSEQFVSRKVTRAAARISAGSQRELVLGSLDDRRDWGHARDVVRGMWLSLQADEPDDYVFATGVARSVRELVGCVFRSVGLNPDQYVKTSDQFVRANSESGVLVGDATRARDRLGWRPEISFESMIDEMVRADLELLRLGAS
jgi:GDPmannose 4,6-dehydratase